MLQRKRVLAEKYINFFKSTDLSFFTEPKDASSNYWLNALILNDKKQRDEFLRYTNENRVMTRPAWKLINKLDMYKKCPVANIENAKSLEERIVNIPSSVDK